MKPPVFDSGWSKEVKRLYEHDIREIWDRSIAPHVWIQYHNQLRIYLEIAGNNPGSRVLDLGCAQGTLALILAERGHVVTALDLRQEFLDYAISRHEKGEIEFVQANVLEFKAEKKYDLVFANQIIEHTIYPGELLAVCKSALAPGGKLVITTPGFYYVKNKLPKFSELPSDKNLEYLQFTADGDGHFFAYTPNELKQLFLECGFEDVVVQYFETPVVSGHMKFRHIQGVVPERVLQRLDRVIASVPLLNKWLSHQVLVSGTCASREVQVNSNLMAADRI